MSKQNRELSDYQEALIELLAGGLSHREVLERLKGDPRFEPYRAYVDGFDIDMVEVGCELIGKWSRRKLAE